MIGAGTLERTTLRRPWPTTMAPGRQAVLQRVTAVLAAAVVATGAVVALSRGGDRLAPDEAALTVNGSVLVVGADGSVERLSSGRTLHIGDTVEAVAGTFGLELPSGAQLEGRAPRNSTDRPTRVEVARRPELLGGPLLAVAEGKLTVVAAGNVLRFATDPVRPAAARLERSLAVGAATYQGEVSIDSAGQRRAVPALRQMEVSVLGQPPTAPAPLRYDESDPWDQRFLGGAIVLSKRLENFARAYTRTLASNEGRTADYYRQFVPGLSREQEFTDSFVNPSRDQGETLVGSIITTLGRRGSFTTRWQQVFSFRDAGAAWGLVAFDQGVDDVPLLSRVKATLNATPFEFARALAGSLGPGGLGTGTTTVGPPTTGGGTGDTSTTTGGGGGGGGGGDTTPLPPDPGDDLTTPPAPTLPPPTLPPPDDGGGGGGDTSTPTTTDLIGPLVDQLPDAGDDLLGGLLEPSATTLPTLPS